jgi:hypothetical protein
MDWDTIKAALVAIGEEQRQELMGVSTPASASVSDTEESGAAPEPPAMPGSCDLPDGDPGLLR